MPPGGGPDSIPVTEEAVRQPLWMLTRPDSRHVKIRDMARYSDLFFALENTLFLLWQDNPELVDENAIEAFTTLLDHFDGNPDDTVAGELAKGVKSILHTQRQSGQPDYSVGEVLSAVAHLRQLAWNHQSPDGVGYLRWLQVFFEGRLPRTKREIREYIEKYES